MTDQNPTSAPVHSELGRASRPICGGEHCTSCPKVTVPSQQPLNGNSLSVGTIDAGILFGIRTPAPAPELTVKQAAKAYRKAAAAAKAADERVRHARRALALDIEAADAANTAASKAAEALRKAAEQ